MNKYEEAIILLDDTPTEAAELGSEALAFVMALHKMFKETGMTSKDEPDLNELENLIDALHGELAAAVLFLCEPSFARAPDMLRAISKNLSKSEDVPTVVQKGFSRLATRIENTRKLQMAMTVTKALDEA